MGGWATVSSLCRHEERGPQSAWAEFSSMFLYGLFSWTRRSSYPAFPKHCTVLPQFVLNLTQLFHTTLGIRQSSSKVCPEPSPSPPQFVLNMAHLHPSLSWTWPISTPVCPEHGPSSAQFVQNRAQLFPSLFWTWHQISKKFKRFCWQILGVKLSAAKCVILDIFILMEGCMITILPKNISAVLVRLLGCFWMSSCHSSYPFCPEPGTAHLQFVINLAQLFPSLSCTWHSCPPICP